jgi:hypothetical protein
MEVSGQIHTPATLPLGKELTGIHLGDWVGSRADLDTVVKVKFYYAMKAYEGEDV